MTGDEVIVLDGQIGDRRDRERAEAPLVMAEGAVLVDSSDLNAQQVIDKVMAVVQSAL